MIIHSHDRLKTFLDHLINIIKSPFTICIQTDNTQISEDIFIGVVLDYIKPSILSVMWNLFHNVEELSTGFKFELSLEDTTNSCTVMEEDNCISMDFTINNPQKVLSFISKINPQVGLLLGMSMHVSNKPLCFKIIISKIDSSN